MQRAHVPSMWAVLLKQSQNDPLNVRIIILAIEQEGWDSGVVVSVIPWLSPVSLGREAGWLVEVVSIVAYRSGCIGV